MQKTIRKVLGTVTILNHSKVCPILCNLLGTAGAESCTFGNPKELSPTYLNRKHLGSPCVFVILVLFLAFHGSLKYHLFDLRTVTVNSRSRANGFDWTNVSLTMNYFCPKIANSSKITPENVIHWHDCQRGFQCARLLVSCQWCIVFTSSNILTLLSRLHSIILRTATK